MAAISFKPSEFSEGGEFPRGTMEITNARFDIHEWKKDGQVSEGRFGSSSSMAAILELTSHDTGTVFEDRIYTVGNPSRYTVSNDGGVLEGSESLSKNCNFAKLLQSLVDLGFPEDKLDGNVRSLVGLVAHWDQPEEGKSLILPMQVYQFPGDVSVNGQQASAPAAPAAKPSEVIELGVGLVKEMLVSNADGATRQALSAQAFKLKDQHEDTQIALMNIIYTDEFQEALAGVGINLDGERFVNA